jgi:ubiquitin-protein ligase
LGLQFLLQEPNATDALNTEAAKQYLANRAAFELKAQSYVQDYCDDSARSHTRHSQF